MQKAFFDSWSTQEIRCFLERARSELARRAETPEPALDEDAALSALSVSFRRFQRSKRREVEEIGELFR
ncbi:MAG: hypothetical protein ACOC00_00225 [Halothiobacillaceae bacterium]